MIVAPGAPSRTGDVFVRSFAAAFAAATLALVVIGALGPDRWRVAVGERGPSCIVKWMTGIDCPFCGMTRATLALGHGDVRGAFALHPLAPVVLVGVLVLFATIAAGRGRALLVGRRPLFLIVSIATIWIVRLAA